MSIVIKNIKVQTSEYFRSKRPTKNQLNKIAEAIRIALVEFDEIHFMFEDDDFILTQFKVDVQ